MKKILIVLGILILGFAPVYAEEQATQETDIDASGVVLVINKQPENTAIKQTVKVRRSGCVVLVNINGKVEIENKTATKEN